MRARFVFYCSAVVALVLILAAASSHATERRDLNLPPDSSSQYSVSANRDGAAGPSRGIFHAKKAAHSAKRAPADPNETKAKSAAKKSTNDGQIGTSGGTK